MGRLFIGSLIALAAVSPAHATPFPGPDDFGYSATQIGENLRVIAGPGIVDADDTVSAALPIGFTFDFYGTDYSEVYVSSNGFLTFADLGNSGCCSGEALPSVSSLHTLVAGFWTDLCPGCAGTVSYETIGTAPNREFVVDYDMVDYCCGTLDRVDFQIILHEDSDIELQYGQMDLTGNTTSVGIEDPTETIGLEIAFGDGITGSVEHRGFLISNAPPPPPVGTTYYPLTVAKAGTGSGTVTGDSYLGIDCGTDCSSLLAQFTFGSLTATPDDGSEFSGWSGPCLDRPEDPSDRCTIHLTWTQNITATFSKIEEPPPPPALCADGLDNDGDGLIDFPSDPGCADASEGDETDPAPTVTEHARALTVEMIDPTSSGGHRLVFEGMLETTDGFAPCSAGHQVVLQKRSASGWRDRKTATTDDEGLFGFSHRAKPGTYRVVAGALTLADDLVSDTCLRAISEKLHLPK